MLWCTLSTTLPFPYQYKCCYIKVVSILFPVCLVLSPLLKKHSNFLSATTSFRKMDWNKHCTAQLKNFLCPSAQTHWTTELYDLCHGNQQLQESKPTLELQGHLSWLFLIQQGLRRYTMSSHDLAAHANLELHSGFALVGSIQGQTCLCLPSEMILQVSDPLLC